MKTIFAVAVTAVALGLAAPVSAADLAARSYTKAPPLVAAFYDWSGFYIGANGGYGNARKCWDLNTPAGTFVVAEGCHDADGAVAGGQIGYRWQSGAFVYGIEAQGNYADLRGSNVSNFLPVFTNRSRIDAFGLFTGQLGYAFNNALLYVKGGAAVTSTRYDVFAAGVLVASADRDARVGGTVGVGLEYGFTPNWSFAVEYDHLFLENRNTDLRNNGVFGTPGSVFSNERIRGDADIITARINYRFGGPVVARY